MAVRLTGFAKLEHPMRPNLYNVAVLEEVA